MRIRSLAVIASLAASLMAAPAMADVTYSWNAASGGQVNSSSQMTFGATQNANEKIKVRAYQIGTLAAGGAFAAAGLAQYSNGLGVTSTTVSSGKTETTNSPQHAMDNDVRTSGGLNCTDNCGSYEFLLVEFDSANYKNLGFKIGWKQNDSDMQVWVGNAAAGLDLSSNATCGASCDFTELGLLGFSQVQTFPDVALNSTQTVGGQLTGRYLLIANRLVGDDGSKDYTKLNMIAGTEYTTKVPEPTSLMLMAAAVAGAGFAGRRRRAA